ncbi:MAG: CBS domain-containing protein [Acetobacteraceae bacterium]
MKAADVMSQPVVAIGPDAPLAQAIRLMVERGFSGLPVLDVESRVVGMLTEGDLMRRVEIGTEGETVGWLASLFTPARLAGRYVHTHGRRVAELMTQEVRCVTEETPLAEVVALMEHHRIKRFPVVRGERLVGIVSRADLVRAVGDELEAPAPTVDDATIRETILMELSQKPWAPANSIGVAVADGTVQLDGSVLDMRERDAVGVVAENVPGVKRVENRIVCIEPTSGVVL